MHAANAGSLSMTILNTSVVWEPEEGGVMTHMVFGLAVTVQGTICAFAEARIHYTDDGAHHLVLKRSVNCGASWEAARYIERSDNGECWANPTAITDRVTGRLFVFYALNDRNVTTRMFYKVSTDEGLTWSDRVEVTGLVQGQNHYGWSLFLPGPGHGVQLRDGRLVLPYWGRKSIALPSEERDYGNGVIYSDDHGVTWRTGGIVPLDRELGNNEARVIERENGELVLNARTKGFGQRAVSISKDQGLNWSMPYADPTFPPRWGCDSGLVSWTDSLASGATVWLYSTIKSKRHDPENVLEIAISRDEGGSWPIRKGVYSGPCNYSDLAVMPDHTVVLVLGAGAYEHCRSFAKEVRLVRIRLFEQSGSNSCVDEVQRIR